MNWWKKQTLNTFRRLGFDLSRYRPSSNSDARRMHVLRKYGVDLVIDVGANTGQYSMELREAGYHSKIVSFEPLPDAFAQLESNASKDSRWDAHNCALGSQEAVETIYVAGNSTSSSLLKMLPAHEEAAPESKYTSEHKIEVKTLDQVFGTIAAGAKSIWLKMDTQGYELNVIRGAANSLSNIGLVQMEVSLIPLYEGAPGLGEVLSTMAGLGYSVIGIDPGFCDNETGHQLQVDITFKRNAG